ncbi:hypothetical protein [Paludibacter sp. 221]|uniref:hypothetical protein n=1 Tax=Paludibacter sp. 221 TaxID=2302939 RepID=UPI0013D38BEA|nr:hypothetical protein [Paludibacter sp. 221]
MEKTIKSGIEVQKRSEEGNMPIQSELLEEHKTGAKEIRYVDESYRMDDNTNFSPTAMEEDVLLDEPLVPGIGIDESDIK